MPRYAILLATTRRSAKNNQLLAQTFLDLTAGEKIA